jgi:hypothetical protein
MSSMSQIIRSSTGALSQPKAPGSLHFFKGTPDELAALDLHGLPHLFHKATLRARAEYISLGAPS